MQILVFTILDIDKPVITFKTGTAKPTLGTNVELQCAPSTYILNSNTFTYSWLHNGASVGTNSATLPLTNIKKDQMGDYTCSITSEGISSTSDVTKIEVQCE